MNRSGEDAAGLLCEFDPSGRLLALATADGVVKAFNSGTEKLEATLHGRWASSDVGQALEPTTSLSWAPLPQEEETAQRSMLVIGSAAGSVQSVSCLTGSSLWRVAEAHDGPVHSTAYIAGKIYTCGSDGKLNALDPKTGAMQEGFSNEAVSIARRIQSANDGENVLLAGAELTLCSSDLRRQIRRFTGHPMHASVLVTDQTGAFAVSSSPGEHALAVWELKPKKKKLQLPAAASLPLETPAVGAAVCLNGAVGKSEPTLYVAANCRQAVLVWECFPLSQNQMKTSLRATIKLKSRWQGAQTDTVLAVHLQPTTDGASLLLARGTPLQPRFERIPISGASSKEIELPLLQDGALLSGKKDSSASKRKVEQPAVISAEPVLPNGLQESETSSGRKRPLETSPEPEPAGAMEVDVQPQELDKEVSEVEPEMTLGERIKALRLQHEQGGAQPAVRSTSGGAGPSRGRADNMTEALTQAIRSDDKAMIERCLANSSEPLLIKTVDGLSAVDAATLLEVAVTRLRSRSGLGHHLVGWIRAILLRHAAYFMAQPGLNKTLGELQQAIEARLALQQPLAALLGRLDLMLAQLPAAQPSPAAEIPRGPVVHLVSQQEEDVEVEDPFAAEAESSGDEELESGESEGEEEEEAESND